MVFCNELIKQENKDRKNYIVYWSMEYMERISSIDRLLFNINLAVFQLHLNMYIDNKNNFAIKQ